MSPSRIVEALDEIEDGRARRLRRAQSDAIKQLALERGRRLYVSRLGD
jgi:hypothetical protein